MSIKTNPFIIRFGTYKENQSVRVIGRAAANLVARALWTINQGEVTIINTEGYPKIINVRGPKRWSSKNDLV